VRRATSRHDRRATIILVSVLAVASMFFAACSPSSNPAAPLTGAVDRAKATADAASRAARQQDLQSGSPDVSAPASQTATTAP